MIEKVRFLKVNGHNLINLEQEVNRMINEGWQPLGEIKILTVDRHEIVIQQMILTTEKT